MTNRITWWLPAWALLFAVALAVLGLRQFEAQTYGLERTWAVQAKGVSSAGSGPGFASEVQEAAGGDATIRKVVVDDLNPAEGYTLYTTFAEYDAHDQRRRDVLDDRERRLRPLGELPRHERSGLWVATSREVAEQLGARLDERGATTQVTAVRPVPLSLGFLASGETSTLVLAVLVLIAGAAGGSAVLAGHRYGVADLQGQRFGAALRDDAVEVVRRGWRPVAFAAGAAVIVVLVAGWGAAAWPLAVVTVTLWLLLVACAVAAHTIGAWLGTRSPLVDRLKGRLPVVPATVVTLLLRNVAFVLAIAAVASALTQSRLLGEYRETASLRESVSTRVHVALGDVLARDFDDPQVMRVGGWVAHEVERGRAMQIAVEDDQTVAVGTRDFRPVLVTSAEYLRLPGVAEGVGRDLAAPGDGAIVYVPRSHPASDTVVKKGVEELFASEQEIARDSGAPSAPLPEVTVRRIDDGARWFVPVSRRTPERSPWLDDPVVISWGGPAERISPVNWASAASLYNVVFESPSTVRQSAQRAGVTEDISSYAQLRSVQGAVSETVVLDAGTSAASAVLACLGVLVGCIGAADLFFSGTRQRRWAQYVHGWPFWRALALPIVVDLMLLAATAGAWKFFHDLGQQGLPPDLREVGPSAWFLILFTIAVWVLSVLALRRNYGRVGLSRRQEGA